MTTYNTRNPIGSTDPRDLYDNSQNIDEYANARDKDSFPDRFGVARKTWHGIEKEAQLQIDRAEQAADDAVAAAGAIGPIKFYDTKAQAQADLANIPEGGLVEIAQDESKDNARTRYKKSGAALEFVINLDRLRIDLTEPTGDEPAGGFDAYSKIRAYSGLATRTQVIAFGVNKWFVRRGTSADNGATVLKDALGRSWEMEYSGEIDPWWWILSSDATPAQCAMGINAALQFAASVQGSVNLRGRAYAITNVRVPNGGVRYFYGGKLIPSGSFGQAAVELDGGTLGGVAVTRCGIRLEIDCVNGPRRAIYGEGVSFCDISENQIYNIDSAKGTVAGIILAEGANNNRIFKNTVLGKNQDDSGVMIGLYSAGVNSNYNYFANGDGSVQYPVTPCYDNQIVGNKTTGGQQGVWLSGAQDNVVANNILRQPKDRGIILIASSSNTVVGNSCFDFGSSGIHMAYGSNDNDVVGNNVRSLISIGEAGIQCYVGCNRNNIGENRIRATSLYGVYCAVSSSYNKFTSNHIDQFRYAAIAIESDWNGTRPEFAIYSRPSFGPPATGSKWAMSDSIGNDFVGNKIGSKAPISSTATGMYMAQINSYDGVSSYGLQQTSFINNRVTTQDNTSNVYIYESTPSKIVGSGLFVSNFFVVNSAGGVIVQPLSTARAFRSFFAKVEGNTTLDELTFFAIPAGQATPSVERGLYFQCSNTSPTTITNFLKGVVGQEITLRGDSNTSIQHNASAIRLKSGMNITGMDSNSLIRFKNIGGIWFELSRNF